MDKNIRSERLTYCPAKILTKSLTLKKKGKRVFDLSYLISVKTYSRGNIFE